MPGMIGRESSECTRGASPVLVPQTLGCGGADIGACHRCEQHAERANRVALNAPDGTALVRELTL